MYIYICVCVCVLGCVLRRTRPLSKAAKSISGTTWALVRKEKRYKPSDVDDDDLDQVGILGETQRFADVIGTNF